MTLSVNLLSSDVSKLSSVLIDWPVGSSPRSTRGTQSSLIPSRQLSQIRLPLAMLPLPPAIRMPVPAGFWNVGHTFLGSRWAIGFLLTSQ